MKKAILALEDGSVFEGHALGAEGTVTAEVCFNTSMTGYQEILTDPSYKGQMVTLTYPEIGNYGIIPEDDESYQPHASGLIIRELSPVRSNFRSKLSLEEYMLQHGIPGIMHIDTRALTKRLRVEGALKGVLSTDGLDSEQAVIMAQEWHGLVGHDYVKQVSCQQKFQWDVDGKQNPNWHDDYQKNTENADLSMAKPEFHVVAYDFGIKYNILRRLREQGFQITVVPAETGAKQVMELRPDGVFLSNGPGDPAAVTYAHQAVRELIGQVPIFGICLGHQILSHALGGRTYKLKFGHRGGNQPVKDLKSGEVKITSQNHGFAVDSGSFPEGDVEVTHINLNDKTCEGVRHTKHSAFSVQYHPEAAPGPNDATYFFSEFRAEVETWKKNA
ncbi:MAG: glutamine-hydrolyzing carbamoyl-phosphate synthase small subunit [Verrucomicrobiota bacterium]